MNERADIFGNDFDVDGFAPATPKAKPDPAVVRKVAESAGFTSREPEKPAPKAEEAPKAQRRIHRTGRNAQFTCKATPETVEAFYAISNAQNWVMGETLERAVAALQKELERGGT